MATAVRPVSRQYPDFERWNWGGFLLSWLWAIGNRVEFSAEQVILGPWIFGQKGNELAWSARDWESAEQFRRVQRWWAIAGFVTVAIVLAAAVTAGTLSTRREEKAAQRLASPQTTTTFTSAFGVAFDYDGELFAKAPSNSTSPGGESFWLTTPRAQRVLVTYSGNRDPKVPPLDTLAQRSQACLQYQRAFTRWVAAAGGRVTRSLSWCEVGGLPGFSGEFKLVGGGRGVRGQAHIFSKGDSAFWLMFAAPAGSWQEYQPAFQQILGSVRPV